jgi:chloramphenicol 3-O phosphotransferase
MPPGNVVLLNGTSSAGKTTTAQALQRIMDTPYLHTGSEHFLPRVPQQFFTIWEGSDPPPAEYFQLLYKGAAPRMAAALEGGQTVFGRGEFVGVRIGPAGVALLAAIYRGIATLAAAGVNVIVDDVLHDRRVLHAAVETFAGLPVLLVGLRLPREVAERRERERGDRGPGGAAAFYDLVHAHAIYDLELDTSILSPEECALRIKAALQAPGRMEAMQRLRWALRD